MKRKSLILVVSMLFVLAVGLFTPAAAEIEVNIDQGNELVKIFNDIYIPADRTVQGDVVAVLGDIKIDGEVTGDVVAVLGDIEVNNLVVGEAVSILGDIDQGPQGEIKGGITELGAAHMAGDIDFHHPFVGFFGWGFRLVKLILMYGLAVLVLALIPDKERKMAVSFRQDNLRKAALGFIALILWPVVILGSIISIVGLPLVPVIILGFFVIKFIGYVALTLFIGERIKQVGNLNINIFLELLLGVIILGLLRAIPVVGAISYLVVAALSLGVIIDTKFGTGNPWFNKDKFQELPEPDSSDLDSEGENN